MALGLAGWCGVQAAQAEYIDVTVAAAKTKYPSTRRFFGELAEMHDKLSKASGIESRLLVSNQDEVNAFATEVKGERIIVLHMGLIDALADDRDALVSVLAHEYAHHGKSHIASTKSNNSIFGVLGAVVGAVIDYKLGTGGLGQDIGGAGAKAITRSFSRDQEREADALGLQWMVEAGYNPAGAVRAQRKFLELAGQSQGFSLFRTHPGSEERVANLEGLIAASDKAKAQSSATLVALALPQDEDEQQSDADTRKLASLAPEPTAAMLEPVNGVSLERFAQMSNDMVFMGEAKALAKHKINAARYAQINTGWTSRMSADAGLGLSTTYSRHYFEASQGKFAVWGKDVAQAMRSGKLQQTEEPISVDDWAALLKAQQAAVKDGQYDAQQFEAATRARGLSSYDFNIVNSWWMQRARERAAKGDMSLMHRLG